jgi:hypothetical protein
MENFKKPNLNAPRFRPEVRSILEKKFFEEFKIKHSQYKNISDAEIRKMIKEFNRFIYQKIVNSRDGVQLPESIGWLFIGTCQESKKKNIDFAKSKEYGLKVTNRNWASDGKLAKIFFTNNAPKHKMKNREFWGFVACREFKRCVAKVYPENWNMYTVVEPTKKLKQLYNKAVYKEISLNKTKKDLLNYNEFDI